MGSILSVSAEVFPPDMGSIDAGLPCLSAKTLGIPSFLPGILLSRKPPKTQKTYPVLEKNDG